MPNVRTFISPLTLMPDSISNKVVVVADILRATSTIHYAMLSGVTEITPVSNVDDAQAFLNTNTLMVGEQSGKLLEGFDILNSPSFFEQNKFEGKSMCFCSTNGSKAIRLTDDSEQTLIGSFLNINAIADFLIDNVEKDVVILCSGWKGNIALEDLLFAGQLIKSISAKFLAKEDTSILALAFYEQLTIKPIDYLKKLALSGKLSGENSELDINAVFKENMEHIIPSYSNGKIKLLETL